MEKAKKFNLGKIIFLCIVIIIPLIATGFICNYSYNRYKDQYFTAYWNNTMEEYDSDTKGQIESYLKYVTHAYTLYHSEEIKVNDDKAFDLNIYRAIYKTITTSTSGEEENNYEVVYYFVVYNVNYKVVNDFRNTGLDEVDKEELSASNLPVIYFNIYDDDTVNNANSADSAVFEETFEPVIYDHNARPIIDETSEREELESYAFMKWVECSISALNHYDTYSNNVNIRLHEDTVAAASASRTINKNLIYGATKENEYNTISLNDFYTDVEDIAEFDSETETFTGYQMGYSEDIIAAGYSKYVWSTYIWWHALIAFVLIGGVTISFFFVWYLEESKEKNEVKTTSASSKNVATAKKTKKK